MCACATDNPNDSCETKSKVKVRSINKYYRYVKFPATETLGFLDPVLNRSTQWSFRGGTRGNAVPIVKIPLERMGTAFPLLSY